MPSVALPAVLTPTLLKSIQSNSTLLKHSWYLITGVTLSVLNRPDEIPKVFNYSLEHDIDGTNSKSTHAQKLEIARRLREGLIKSAAVAGLPKTINGLFALKSATPPDLFDEPSMLSPSSRADDVYNTPSSKILERGQDFFNKLYGKVAKRVMGQMDRSGTEDLGLTARLIYGYVLSNTNILTPAETSFVLIAGLIPQDVNPQLKGHLRGATNNGASTEQVRAVRETVIGICEACGMTRLSPNVPQGFGWREEVADL